MIEILKGKIDKNSHASWLLTTIKNLTKRSVKDLRIPVFSFRLTQESALHNRNILAAFDGNLGKATKDQKGTPLDYGSEFCDITWIIKLFSHHEEKHNSKHNPKRVMI